MCFASCVLLFGLILCQQSGLVPTMYVLVRSIASLSPYPNTPSAAALYVEKGLLSCCSNILMICPDLTKGESLIRYDAMQATNITSCPSIAVPGSNYNILVLIKF